MVLALTLIGVSACPYLAYADEDTKESIGLTVDIGADLVSSYLWRGQNLGGMSLQPSVTVRMRMGQSRCRQLDFQRVES